jgi:hypothetical protein
MSNNLMFTIWGLCMCASGFWNIHYSKNSNSYSARFLFMASGLNVIIGLVLIIISFLPKNH